MNEGGGRVGGLLRGKDWDGDLETLTVDAIRVVVQEGEVED